MVKKSNGWNLQDMQATLVKDTEERIEQGFEEIKQEQGGVPSGSAAGSSAAVPDGSPSGSQQEPTKGVQTYIPISQYMRLSNQKLTRPKGTTIAILAAEAIALWLDVQEGKLSVQPK